MIRIEIIANHSVEENILDAMQELEVGKFYTNYPGVYGVGSAGPRMGDAIWPEENFALVIWCDEEEARGIDRAVAQVKVRFPDEGIKIFGIPDASAAVPVMATMPMAAPAVVAAVAPMETAPAEASVPAVAVPAVMPEAVQPAAVVPAVVPPPTYQYSEEGPEDPNAE
jgi:hypothetical protein